MFTSLKNLFKTVAGKRPPWAQYRIQVLGSWADKREVFESIKRQTKDGRGRWENLQFTFKENDIDYYLAINSPRLHSGVMQKHDPARTLVWIVEHNDAAWRRDNGYDEFYNNPSYLKTIDHRDRINWGQFHIHATYSDLISKQIPKTMDLSTVTSSIALYPLQKKRIGFLKFLENKDLSFSNNGLHHYGHANKDDFKYYKGPLPPQNKDAGLSPYKYHIAFESNQETNYITEKLFDAILCECLVFYCGCPNLADWIDPKAVIQLDPDNYELSYQRIKKAVENNEWGKRLPFIKKEKEKILNRYNVFPAVKEILEL